MCELQYLVLHVESSITCNDTPLTTYFANLNVPVARALQVSAVSEPKKQQELVTVSLRFLDLTAGSMRQESLTACIARPEEAPEGRQVDAALQEALHRVNTANAIKAAVREGDAGHLQG